MKLNPISITFHLTGWQPNVLISLGNNRLGRPIKRLYLCHQIDMHLWIWNVVQISWLFSPDYFAKSRNGDSPTLTQHLKITEKVSFYNFASEASKVHIFESSRQKSNDFIDCWSWVRKFKWDIFCWCSNTVPNLFFFFQNGAYSFYFLLWLIATLPKKKKRIKYFQRKQESLLTQTLLTVKGNQTVLNA